MEATKPFCTPLRLLGRFCAGAETPQNHWLHAIGTKQLAVERVARLVTSPTLAEASRFCGNGF